ncbi:MAG: leucine-rich repeat domain-containing protein [Akkermansiaceae bacterium]
MKTTSFKSTVASLAIIASFLCLPNSLSASDAITPYLETGKTEQFSYAIYNNRWLLDSLKPGDEKGLKRIAITGVLPGVKGQIVLPASIDGHEVYGIDENALSKCEGVTEIVLPKTIRFLKAGTLNRCKGLQKITVAEDHPEFSSMDGLMFNKEKTKLLSVPSGRQGHFEVPAKTAEIGPGAFAFCIGLKSVSIPAGVTDIGNRHGWVFQGCVNLERIDLPETVTNIGQKSFQDCSSLKELTIPPKVTAIPFGLFWKCGELKTVTLPDQIVTVGNYAFADCTNLTLEKLPKALTEVGAYAFKNCKGLKGLKVPGSVTKIGRGAFAGTEAILPKKGAI